jgi:hypothetical protein
MTTFDAVTLEVESREPQRVLYVAAVLLEHLPQASRAASCAPPGRHRHLRRC